MLKVRQTFPHQGLNGFFFSFLTIPPDICCPPPQLTPQVSTQKEDCLNTSSPTRRVQDNTHEQTRDEAGAGQGDEPTHVDPSHHPPVDTPPRSVTETHPYGRAADTLSGRDGELKLGGHNNGDSGAELHRETTRRRMQRNLVAESTHDVVAVRPETNDDTGTAKSQDPRWHGDTGANVVCLPDEVDCGVGANGIGHVVGTVCKGCGRGGEDLEEGVSVLG